MGADVHFRLQDVTLSQTAVQDLNHSLRMLAQVTLSRALEGKTAIIIQMDRKVINMHLQVSRSPQEPAAYHRDTQNATLSLPFHKAQNIALNHFLPEHHKPDSTTVGCSCTKSGAVSMLH